MTWTVNRRIVFGFSIVLALLLVVAGIGVWALASSSTAYENALEVRRHALLPALQAESEARATNMAYLRFLLEGSPQELRIRDSTNSIVRSLIAQLQDSADTDGDRQFWHDAAALHQRWTASVDAAIAAKRANNAAEAVARNIATQQGEEQFKNAGQELDGRVVLDRFGNYNIAWGALIAIGIIAFTLQWLMDERLPHEGKHAGARGAIPA
jgi:CHASE3 domain sensor protein